MSNFKIVFPLPLPSTRLQAPPHKSLPAPMFVNRITECFQMFLGAVKGGIEEWTIGRSLFLIPIDNLVNLPIFIANRQYTYPTFISLPILCFFS